MSRLPLPRKMEFAFERWVERPFLRRARVSLPLLRGSLRRAMRDEVKAVVPSRYTITVPAEQMQPLDAARAEWERDLGSYFLQLLRENGWSAIGQPRVVIAYDPALHGDEVRVAVEEPGLIYNGGTLRSRGSRTPVATTLGFLVILVLSALVLALIIRPDLLGRDRSPGTQPTAPEQPLVLPWASAQHQAESWWENMRGAILGRASGDRQGEVVASPCLAVRAGQPSTKGETIPASCIPRGTSLRWREDQVVNGESFGGEDRWLHIGEAGPEWGERRGYRLYVWMGGVKQR